MGCWKCLYQCANNFIFYTFSDVLDGDCAATKRHHRSCMSCNINTQVNMHIFTHTCLIYTQPLAIKSQCNMCQSMTSVDTNVGETAEQRCHSYHHSGPHTELHPWERKERTFPFISIRLGWVGSEKPNLLLQSVLYSEGLHAI